MLKSARNVLTTTILVLAFTLYAHKTSAQTSPPPSALTREELTTQVQEKAKQLDDIGRELESARETLKETTTERKTLQREVKTIENNISQLNLSIKSDQITMQKLGLEIDSLGYDIRDVKSSIETKRQTIKKLLVELQKNDRASRNMLSLFLKSSSLAGGVLELQNLASLQSQLAMDIGGLRVLHETLNEKLTETSGKKEDIVFHERNLANRKIIVQDQKTERQSLLTQTKSKETIFQKQVTDLEKLQQQIATEVEALGAILRTKIDPSLLPPLRSGVLAIPVAGKTKSSVTQDYGATAFAQYGYRGKWHNGIDIGAPLGTPILASEDGAVVAVGDQDAYCYRGAYGKFIVIDHGNYLTTLYAHLSRQIVKKGDKVKRGAIIGYAGRTGYATGPHLHFTVFATPTFYMGPSKVCGQMPYGGDLNPLGYL